MALFETPILFLVFNRPDETKKVFESIRKIAPKYFYIAADGPRNDKPGEIELCETVKGIVENIDWDCEVHKLYREENLGCGLAVSGAIGWFFQHVEMGIILEDDTLPDESFFNYCRELLQYYKDDESIMHISGDSYVNHYRKKESYYFTRLPFIWGWATWRRAWSKYSFNYKNITPEQKLAILKKAFNNTEIINYWNSMLADFHARPKSYTWDFQWFLTIWDNMGFVIQPGKNLVQNIGFSIEATHTIFEGHYLSFVKAEKIHTITHNAIPEIDEKLQRENFNFFYGNNTKKPVSSFFKKDFSPDNLKRKGRGIFSKLLIKLFPELSYLKSPHISWYSIQSTTSNVQLGNNIKLYNPYHLYDSCIGEYSYIAYNATIYNTDIGKFCSIGPNLLSGYGIHPVNGLSTAPMFYSTEKQNGTTLSKSNKVIERKRIQIGNDVFIGANVTILDGVTIGDGAVIGAGAIVSKDIPPYAIAVGAPIEILRYRFEEVQIEKLLSIKWWDFEQEDLFEVEKYFFEVEAFINKYTSFTR